MAEQGIGCGTFKPRALPKAYKKKRKKHVSALSFEVSILTDNVEIVVKTLKKDK